MNSHGNEPDPAQRPDDVSTVRDTSSVMQGAHQDDPMVGRVVGQYRIKRVIGSGGMGTVYEAVQENPRRTVGLKMLKQGISSKNALRRFEYEAQALGRLRHQNIAQIYEAGSYDDGTGGRPWFAMELIVGKRELTTYCNEKQLANHEKLALFRQVCDAVQHGHQKGIIHRDLKPSNILVTSSGVPKIIDFGVARSTDSDMAVTTLQTDVGALIGTLQYMSPEQCAADPADIDTRSDVYALGVILYELLCESLPYDVTKVAIHEAARIVQEEPPTKPSTIDKRLRGDIETITLKAMEKDRDRRYQTAVELEQDIDRYLAGDAITAKSPSAIDLLRRLARRHKAASIAMASVFVVLVAAVIAISIFAVKAKRSEELAQDMVAQLSELSDQYRAASDQLAEVNLEIARKYDELLEANQRAELEAARAKAQAIMAEEASAVVRQWLGEESQQDIETLKHLANTTVTIGPEVATLGDMVTWLGEQAATSVNVDWGALKQLRLDEESRVNLQFTDITILTLLDFLGTNLGRDLEYDVIDGSIWISSRDAMSTRLVERVYEIDDLFTPEELATPKDYGGGPPWMPPLLRTLIDQLPRTSDQMAMLQPGGQLLLRSTRKNHQQLSRLLGIVRGGAVVTVADQSEPSPWVDYDPALDDAVLARLAETRITPDWEANTWREMLQDIAEASSVSISMIRENSLGMRRLEKPTAFNADEMSAMAALDLILRPRGLDFDITQGQVIVGEPHDIHSRTVTRVYERPLGSETPTVSRGRGEYARTIPVDIALLDDLAAAWEQNEFSYQPIGERIVVITNARTQRRVAEALAQLAAPAQATVTPDDTDSSDEVYQRLQDAMITPAWEAHTLEDMLREIAEASGVCITVIGRSNLGIWLNKKPVAFHAGEMSALAALDLILRPRGLDFDITQGQVLVGIPEDVHPRVITRAYQRPFSTDAIGSPDQERPLDIAFLDDLAVTWELLDFTCQPIDDRLLVTTNARTQRRVAEALAQLAAPAQATVTPGDADSADEIHQRLQEVMITPAWEAHTWEDMLREIAEASGVSITVIGRSNLGIWLNKKPVAFHAGEMSALAALDLVLQPQGLDFDINQEQVLVGIPTDIHPRVITRTYRRPFGSDTPTITQTRNSYGRNNPSPPTTVEVPIDLDLLKQLASTWEVADFSVHPAGDRLVITTTNRNHHRCAEALALMTSTAQPPVATANVKTDREVLDQLESVTLAPQWEQTTVLEIAREIADAANMTIVVFTDPISQRLFDKTVDFSGDRLSALAALDLVLRPHGLHFDVREGQIMIGMPGALPIEVTAARYKRPLGGETPLVTQRNREIPADVAAINAYAWQANMMVDCWVVGDELMITGSPRMHHAIRGLLAGIGESQAVP